MACERLVAVGMVTVMLVAAAGCASNLGSARYGGSDRPGAVTKRPATAERPSPPGTDVEDVVVAGSEAAGPEVDSEELARRLSREAAPMKTGIIAPRRRGAPSAEAQDADERIKVVFNFEKADIAEVTSEIFGNFLKRNYVLDPTLQGRISLYLEGEYTQRELLQLITRAYAANNVAVVPREGVLFVQPYRRSSSSRLPVADEFLLESDRDGVRPAIIIYRPRYLDAKQVLNSIRFFLTPGQPVTTDPLTNTIIFAEETENARTILDLLRALDMDVLGEIGMEIVPLQALSPSDAAESLEALLNKLDVFKMSALKSNVAFIPLEQLGGVLILAQNPKVLETAKQWLSALDAQGRESGEQINIYFVENSLAADIAAILSQLYEDKGTRSSERLSQRVVEAVGAPQVPSEGTRTGNISTTLTGPVSIIADEANNALVVKANAADYARIKKTIEALDIVPRAVLIEVLIAEVTLNDEIQYGVEWFLKERAMDIGGTEGAGSVVLETGQSFSTDFTLNSGAPVGLSVFWGSLSGDIAALIRLLSSKTNVHVLSTPTLLATDNQEASINVGGREPIITQQSTNVASDANIINTIQYEDTGIILTVLPHINSGGLVRMDVEQTIRNAVANTISGIDSPRFDERKVKTTLLAKNGRTVIIGGIIQHRQTRSRTGIPILSDLPVLSPLFSTKGTTTSRTELIIAITPYVVRHDGDEVSEEFLEKLRDLKRRIESTAAWRSESSILGGRPGGDLHTGDQPRRRVSP